MEHLRDYFDVMELAKKYDVDPSLLGRAYSIGSEVGYLNGHQEGYDLGWDMGSACCKSQIDWDSPVPRNLTNEGLPKKVEIHVSGFSTEKLASLAILKYTNIDAVSKGYLFFNITDKQTSYEAESGYSFTLEYVPSNIKKVGYIRAGFPQMGPMLSESDLDDPNKYPYSNILSGTGYSSEEEAKEKAMNAISNDLDNKGYNHFNIIDLRTPRENNDTYSFHVKYEAKV